MTHTGPMPESAGEFQPPIMSSRPCKKCGAPMTLEIWESSDGAYEDEKHTCTKCGHVRWVDGGDS